MRKIAETLEAVYIYRNVGLKTIVVPSTYNGQTVTKLEKIYVQFNKGEQPEGWDSSWSNDCNATIVYANGETEQLNSES